MPQADTPTNVASVRVDTSALPGIESHSVRWRRPRVKPRTGTRVATGTAPYASNAAAAASCASRSERPRFTALTTARSEAVTIEE